MSELRLHDLVVENFRSISGRLEVPLDASVTLIHGANGAGKTSLLSAIELGATGTVGFLDEQVGDSLALLRNHDYPIGRVRLSLREERGGSRVGAFELHSDRAQGNPALGAADRTYFRERTFLPQTALGRLLESYTETGQQVDTALIRFVKSLIGLDDLDALIEGLYSASNVLRSKKLVPNWKRVEDENTLAEGRRTTLRAELVAANYRLHQSVSDLRNLLGDAAAELDIDGLLERILPQARESETSRAGLARLEELRAKVDTIAALMSEQAIDDSETDIARADAAEEQYQSWEAGDGAEALAELNRVRVEFFDLQHVSSLELREAFDETLSHAIDVARRIELGAAAEQRVQERRDALTKDRSSLDVTIFSREAALAALDVPSDVRVFVDILRLTLPLVGDSQTCPVCDQNFTGTQSLWDHLTSKLEHLSQGSQRLIEIEQDLSQLRIDRARLDAELSQLGTPNDPRPVSESPAVAIRSLNAIGDQVAQGTRLLRALRASQARRSEVSARRAERAVLAERITEVSEGLGISATEVPSADTVRVLTHEIAERIQRVQFTMTRRKHEQAARELIEDARREVLEIERNLDELDTRVRLTSSQLSAAVSRVKGARRVLQLAEKTRSRLINQVFDQSLNSLWKQLFIRFAPTERFTPRFTKQTTDSRSVDVRLETELPDGEVSGSPAAMLSYGNTNSAALSLFMALHLSGPSQLPWLIFDDPVQSMDDIHVSNFAAIVRQLAYVHNRQVLIAIHQRELFDYLSMELAPSAEGQSLVRLTLDRSGGTTELEIKRINYEAEAPLTIARGV